MKISLIVAVAENGVIGKMGKIPWRIPADVSHFKAIVQHHTVIMGRKTYETIRHPLSDKQNIVVTHNQNLEAAGYTSVSSLQDALSIADHDDEVFIIGGGKLYETALPYADTIYLTLVHAAPDGDTYFTYNSNEWRQTEREYHETDSENQYPFSYLILKRIKSSD